MALVALLWLSVNRFRRHIAEDRREVSAEATITDVVELHANATRDDPPSVIQRNSYRFSVQGQEFTGRFESDPGEDAVGGKVEIEYLPENPARNHLKRDVRTGDYVFQGFLCIGVGAAAVLTLLSKPDPYA